MEYNTRKLIMPAHLNPANTLFGGQMLAWIDEECAIAARLAIDTLSIVTAHMSEINFVSPARQGDVIEFGVEVVKYGKKSVTLRCVVRNLHTKKDIITVDKIVFVSIDEHGRSIEHAYSYRAKTEEELLDELKCAVQQLQWSNARDNVRPLYEDIVCLVDNCTEMGYDHSDIIDVYKAESFRSILKSNMI